MGEPRADGDADVVRRWQAGDPAAFAALVRAWEKPVGRLLARLVGDPHVAGDLLQETFTRVYLSAGSYRHDGRFGAWVYRVAVNQARDFARRRRPTAPLSDHDPPGREGEAGTAIEGREQAAVVTAALADLPPPLREVLVLRHYEGLSFEDMGRLLGTPASTLKSRFAAAGKAMVAALIARGIRPEDVT